MTTYEVGFKVQHDCPFNDLSKEFPTIVFAQWCNNDKDILEVSYDRLELYDAVQESIQNLAKKLGVRITKKIFTERNQQLFIGHCGCDHFKSVCPTIEKNHCLELQPTIYREGWEWYRVIAFSDRDIKNLFRGLGEFCNVEVVSRIAKESGAIRDNLVISASGLVDNLTDKQLQALLFAVANGYYRVPKKVKTTEIASLMGVPRTTYEEHLRIAESKILGTVAPYLQLTPRKESPRALVS
jgi:predicted DNA binding protein